MRILGIIIFEYVLGYILQGFIFILGIYAYSRLKIEIKKFVLASIVYIIISFVMRILPISFGIHTILDLICLFAIAVLFLKIPAFESIKALLIITIILLMTEFSTVFIMTNIIGQAQFDAMMSDSLYKAILSIPATIFFLSVISISYYIIVCKKKTSEKVGKDSL
jgi:hypothetical protein